MRTSPRLLDPRLLLVLLLTIAPMAGCGGNSKENPDKDGSVAKTSNNNDDEPTAEGKTPSQRADDEKHPRINIETSLGNIVVRLDAEKAPLTVNNFMRYVNEGFYNDTLIHEVRPGYAVICGTYDENLTAKPTHGTIYNEARNGLKNVRGTLAMARSEGIDSATSAFFINLADNSSWMDHKGEKPEEYGYCVFGEVVDGMDVAERISKVKVHKTTDKNNESLEQCPVEPVIIRSMRLLQ